MGAAARESDKVRADAEEIGEHGPGAVRLSAWSLGRNGCARQRAEV